MGQPFDQWTDRVEAASDDESRRSLMAEVALWRARRLHDVVASRRATYALSRLHELLDERDEAVREARSLLSLCQTPPAARDEEVALAKSHLQQLGATVPPMPGMERGRRRRGGAEPRPARQRSSREDRPRESRPRDDRPSKASQGKPGAQSEARAAALAGDFDRVHQLARGRSGPTWALLRVHADLTSLKSETDLEKLQQGLAHLQDAVGRSLSLGDAPRPAPEADPLSQLLGQPTPKKRGPRLRAIERFADEHPERLDELAEAALRHHVQLFGNAQAAPWLVGTVGRAMAHGEAPRTAAVIDELGKAGSMAVLAYDEWPYSRLVRLMTRARSLGWAVTSLRRGVLSRGEPAERKLWTLRLRQADGPERMVVASPHATEAYEDGKATELAERCQTLCSRTLVLATGSGNAGLRSASAQLGLTVLEVDADDTELLAALEAVEPTGSTHEPGKPAAPDLLVEALAAEDVNPESLAPILTDFRRPTKAFRVAERAEPTDASTAALLLAVPTVVPDDESLADGTTLAVRVAAAGGGATRAVLEGPLQARYGGPALVPVTELATALVSDGWQVFRVLRGPTRRERQHHPVLETLSDSMRGVWRVLVRRDAVRGEVWYIEGLAPEGRAGVPQLLVEDRQRAVVLPVEPELLAWYGELGGPTAIGWTGDEADALREAVSAWSADPSS